MPRVKRKVYISCHYYGKVTKNIRFFVKTAFYAHLDDCFKNGNSRNHCSWLLRYSDTSLVTFAPESNYDLLSLFIVEYFYLVIQFLNPDKTTADTRVR